MNWIAFAAALALGWLWNGGASGHSWYPWECCSNRDCGPAELVDTTPEGQVYRNFLGEILVPYDFKSWRLSPDGKVHVCIQKGPGIETKLLCAFKGADS